MRPGGGSLGDSSLERGGVGASTHQPAYVDRVSNKTLLCSTGSCTQDPVTDHNAEGEEIGKRTFIYVQLSHLAVQQ